jgi:hypothetical protein
LGNLVVNPTYLTFNYSPGAAIPPSQVLSAVSSNGGSVPFFVSGTIPSGGGWLHYSPTSANKPNTLVVSVNPSGLPAGTYCSTLTSNSNTPGIIPTPIPVTLTVTSNSQLQVSPSSLVFDYQAGGAIPHTQYVSVTSTGSSIPFTVGVQGPAGVSAKTVAATRPPASALLPGRLPRERREPISLLRL